MHPQLGFGLVHFGLWSLEALVTTIDTHACVTCSVVYPMRIGISLIIPDLTTLCVCA